MTQKGLSVLQALIDAGLSSGIAQVIIGRDAKVQKDYAEEIKALCEYKELPYAFRQMKSEPIAGSYALAVSWRWMLPLDLHTLIVFHDSLLPRYRGFAPLVSQLIEGESELGVTALFASKEYDRGDIIASERVKISYPIRIQEAIEAIVPLYGKLAVQIVRAIAAGKRLQARPQDEALATYSLWRDDQDYYINWTWPADKIERFVDATGFPYLGARTTLDGKEIILEKVKALPDVSIHNRTAGKVIFVQKGQPVVVCGKDLLRIEKAHYAQEGYPILPLKGFRKRFGT